MQTEFITLNSRLAIKKGVIQETKLKLDEDEGFTRIVAFCSMLLLLAFCVYSLIEEKKYFFILQIILILMWLEPFVRRIYQAIFIKTWKSKVRLTEIKKTSLVPLPNELETRVILHLQNGRQKHYIFRNAEHQHEAFIQMVSSTETGMATA